MLAKRKQPSGFPHVERALTVCRNIETEGGVGGDGTSNLSRLVDSTLPISCPHAQSAHLTPPPYIFLPHISLPALAFPPNLTMSASPPCTSPALSLLQPNFRSRLSSHRSYDALFVILSELRLSAFPRCTSQDPLFVILPNLGSPPFLAVRLMTRSWSR